MPAWLWPIQFWSILVLYGAVGFCAFAMYGWDKRAARLDRSRVPERRLHLINLLGGWPGGLIGSRVFRHKTRKVRFRVVFWLTGLPHFVGWGVWAWWALSRPG